MLRPMTSRSASGFPSAAMTTGVTSPVSHAKIGAHREFMEPTFYRRLPIAPKL